MPAPRTLRAEELYQRCDPESLDFDTTATVDPPAGILGQDRAIESMRFGTGMRSQGYNLFVLGPSGIGKHEVVERFLAERAEREPTPPDRVYLNNFEQGNRPLLVEFPAGEGERLRRDLADLVEELRRALPATFDSDEYQNRMRALQQRFGRRQQEAFKEIQEEAERHSIAVVQTSNGFTFAPQNEEGETLEPEAFRDPPAERRREVEQIIEDLQKRVQEIIRKMPRWRKEAQEKIGALNEEMAELALGNVLAELRERYRDYPWVTAHLEAVQRDVVNNIDALLSEQGKNQATWEAVFARYQANLFVDNRDQQGAPVVYEDYPTYQHLVGRVEHQVQEGALTTDFRLVRAGALHRANGGYLLVDARKVLTQPFAWEAIKRALYAECVRIESVERMYGLMSTVTLEPEPAALNVKIVLMGERVLYYLLSAYDPDFLELFKVQADFEEDLPRSAESERLFARMIAGVVRRDELKPFSRTAVARVIEHGSRIADHSERLTTHNRAIADLLHEAHYWAGEGNADTVAGEHVQQAIDHQVYRASRVDERLDLAIREGTILIDTAGSAPAQVNGLSVIQLGDHAFGRPTRITATARLGNGRMVDIEREAKLGGNIHSKGVMILSNLLASRYARDQPLSLAASLAFEQSYGTVDGDSASVAEFCALASALSGLPVRQSTAVTGSLNQHGRVQAVGGVNYKIEGFFDVCRERGLDGEHGVALPAANVRHLMLRADIRRAVEEDRFRVYALEDIDQALELLLGRAAGEADDAGVYPEDTVNRLVADRLQALADIAQAQGKNGNGGDGEKSAET